MKLVIEMTEQELSEIDLVKFTGLDIGSRVDHVNAGKHGGSGTTIYSGQGTILELYNNGVHHWGGLSVLVKVLWDNGESYMMDYKLAKKAKFDHDAYVLSVVAGE